LVLVGAAFAVMLKPLSSARASHDTAAVIWNCNIVEKIMGRDTRNIRDINAHIPVNQNLALVYVNGPGLMGIVPFADAAPGTALFLRNQFIIVVCHLDILRNVLIAFYCLQ